MAFDQRPPTSGGVSPIASPNLPIADSSQAHDIPTGVGPSLAKLQDWIAWFVANGVLYDDPVGTPGLVANDITIDGDLTVTGAFQADNVAEFNQLVGFFNPALSYGADAGANVFHKGLMPKAWARLITDGVGGCTILGGYNYGLATVTATYVDLDFNGAMADALYSATATNMGNNTYYAGVDSGASTTAKVRLVMRDAAAGGAIVDPSTTVCQWSLTVMGNR